MSRNAAWKNPPAPIPAEKISKVYEAEVVVVGLGYAGTGAFRAAVEEGAKTIAIEKQTEEKYISLGQDYGHLNSKFLASRGVPKVDEIEYFNEWMNRTSNHADPRLIMKFVKNVGSAFDWFIDVWPQEEIDNIRVTFWPTGEKFDGSLGNNKFYVGTAQFPGWFGKGHPSLTDTCRANHKLSIEKGGQAFFGISGEQLTKDETGRVNGVIGKDAEGNYILYKASKGVVLTAGDFGGDKEMCEDLLPDIEGLFTDENKFQPMGSRDGSGIKMGVWAGGRMEAGPIATMGGNYNNVGGLAGVHAILWLDPNGKRYCNETFGDNVFAGLPGNQMKRGTYMSICDSAIFEDAQWAAPQHMGFDAGNPESGKRIKNIIANAYKAGAEGIMNGPMAAKDPDEKPEPPKSGMGAGGLGDAPGLGRPEGGHAMPKIFAADTFEELFQYAGLTGKAYENALASVKRYNELCELGRDEDFGKESKLLRPLNQPPYVLQQSRFQMVGTMMVTVGGLLTNENQAVLDYDFEPIPGLYASGNCCGRRFGPMYSTPISGSSVAIAHCLGREAGIAAANGIIE